ncbi:TPA: DUF4160 domain-containing protein [Candidatus Poribacteria bacterium]|nr:DUF4160 domain-containing protein [Candidatus Poribacteria bacterium]HEX29594.1 DUF4160 domain-containing protein [Candidatus Poribacteria bacterium]
MPEICRFFGIVIRMYFADHPPPHFHVEYGEHRAVIDIRTLVIIEGYLPPRAHSRQPCPLSGPVAFAVKTGAALHISADIRQPDEPTSSPYPSRSI